MESSKGLRPAAEISTYFTSVQTRYNMRMIERLTVYVFLTAISTAPQSSSEQEPFAYCARGGGVTADEILGLGGRAAADFVTGGDSGRTFTVPCYA